MKIVNNRTLPKISLVSYLVKRIAPYHLHITQLLGNVQPAFLDHHNTFSHTIELEPKTRTELEFGSRVIGGIAKSDPNRIILYDDAYLQLIEELVKQFESYSPGAEITIELNDWPTRTA